MIALELRLLRYFITIVQEGSISKAAEVLHITQPTLSRQLKDLEDYFDIELFIRGKRQIILTDNGLLFYQRAKEIIELADKTEKEFFEIKESISGTIAIGCVESRAVYDFMEYINLFSKKYRNITFDVYNGYADDIKDRLDKGLTEIGILVEPVDVDKYDFIRLQTKEQWGILAPIDSELAKNKTVQWSDLENIPLIVPKRHYERNELAKVFRDAPEHLNIIMTYNLFSNMIYMVENGTGYALCIDGALSIRNNNKTKFLPFEPEYATGSVLVWKKNNILGKPANLLVETYRENNHDK